MSARKRSGSQQPNMGWKQQKQQNRKQQAAESQREAAGAVARETTRPTQADTAAGSKAPAAAKAAGGDKEPVTIALAGGHEISDRTYGTVAESIMEQASAQGFWRLTTTKLRGIYGLITNVSLKVSDQADFERHAGDVQYLQVRMAYEAGRETSVRSFLEATDLMRYAGELRTVEQFRLYCRYAEALVAYFKFFGGKDK